MERWNILFDIGLTFDIGMLHFGMWLALLDVDDALVYA